MDTVKTKTLTIMIVDLVGSTQLVERSSREQLVAFMEDATLPIRHAVAEFGGKIIKFTGDGYLATFGSASEALHAARTVIEGISEQPTLPNGTKLEGCRVVLHTSDVIIQNDDVIGEGVVIAARLEKHVPTNHIYLTSTVREVAKSGEFEFELVGDFALKGLAHPIKVYQLITQPFSGMEHDSYLTITDLLGMTQFMTEAPIDLVNRALQRWIGFQREAIAAVNGRLRAIVGDNLVTTYEKADDAVLALIRLQELVINHNNVPGEMMPFRYTSVTCKGDLFVLSFGIHGPLVSRAFRLLGSAQDGDKLIEGAVYRELSAHHDQLTRCDETEALYRLNVFPQQHQ